MDLDTSRNAQERGWGQGWPHDRSGDMAWAQGGEIRLFVHKGIAELVGLLLDACTERFDYDFDHGGTDDWGYANRPITGTTSVPSNHSWGLAVDLNARENPYGAHLVTDMPKNMVRLWNDYGFRWGGTYGGNKDAMHYEFMGTPMDAKRLTERARKELGADMSFEEFKDGVALRMQDKKVQDDAPVDKKFGWRFADRALSSRPAPSDIPALVPHTHPIPVRHTGAAQQA